MWVLYLICGITVLVLYIWKKPIRHIINTIIIWVLQIITWCLQGAGWFTGVLVWLFQMIDGRNRVDKIGGNINQNPQKTLVDAGVDLNSKEGLTEFLKNSKNYRIEPITK
jgi:hypothetical protein